MGQDVFATTHLGIFSREMIQFVQRGSQTSQTFFHGGKNGLIQCHDAHDRGQIIGGPEPFHIGLCGPYAAIKENAAIKSLVMNVQTGLQHGRCISAKR